MLFNDKIPVRCRPVVGLEPVCEGRGVVDIPLGIHQNQGKALLLSPGQGGLLPSMKRAVER